VSPRRLLRVRLVYDNPLGVITDCLTFIGLNISYAPR